MKKLLFTLILMAVTVANLFAQSRRSIIKVRLSDNSRLAVSINDRYYDKQGTSITIGDLPAGRHYIKIYRYVPYATGRGGKARVVYSGGIRLSEGTISEFTYDVRRNEIYATTEFIDDTYDDRRDDRRDDRYDDRRDDRYEERDDIYNNRRGRVWTQQDMSDLKKRVDDRMMDGEKQKLMQSVLQDRRYTTEQMRTMLNWLSFESTKVEVAKWGYDNVSDKQNYWKLESEFTFSSSKDEFNNYINGRR
ncbi:MAG: DUF4476 domain-containing protein [Flavipsychrobacter sp.]|nr:DUF4476 domain-containing protein [Flavipsychrobacter sp.]